MFPLSGIQREFVMNNITRKLAMLTVSVACTTWSLHSASAASANGAISAGVTSMSQAAKPGVDLVRMGGHHFISHGFRHRHHRNVFFFTPFVAAPFLYDYSYGYGSGYDSCYQACRYDHGPGFCQVHWRRYCY